VINRAKYTTFSDNFNALALGGRENPIAYFSVFR
jgi:hypothetical protein